MKFRNHITMYHIEGLHQDGARVQCKQGRAVQAQEGTGGEDNANNTVDILDDLLKVENADMDRDIDEDYRKYVSQELQKDEMSEEKIVSDHRFRQLQAIIAGHFRHSPTNKFNKLN